MIFPIGRYAGATGDGSHEVRVGGRTERLDVTTFATWGLAHGPVDPVLAAAVPWTRPELVRYAGQAGMAEPDRLVTELLERGLLAEAPATGPEAVGFARAHRAVPLAVGLGNDPEAPHRYAIGHADRVLVELDEPRYEVWCWSTVYPTLWEVCQARATATPRVDLGVVQPDLAESGLNNSKIDADRLLTHFLTGVHELASANALYLEAV